VRRCPTGALQYARHDGGAPEPVPDRNLAIVSRSGPNFLRGDLRLVDDEGRELVRETRMALCRCGASKNKPFCDNSHWEIGFRDAGALSAIGLQRGDADAGTPPHGPLTVHASENGPIEIGGDFELLQGDGQMRQRGVRATLCRCGHSENKPFCDGSHRSIGFTAEPLA
jgi:CDGSH-type Zn-finger protein